MEMKKTVVALGVALLLGMATVQMVSARGWGGGGAYGGGGYGGGYGPCAGYGMNNPQMDPAIQEKVEAFFNETAQLRRQMSMKRAEKQALLSQESPDPAAVAQVQGELFDLRMEMRQKALDAGVPMMGGPRGRHGGGYGRHGGGNYMMRGY